MRDYDLLINGETKRDGNIKTDETDTKTGLHVESPPKDSPCTQPSNRTEKR
jgi:hypothetical protein